MTLQWRRHQNGRVKLPQRRFCARRLDRSSAESEAMEATSRLQLIAASCSAIPTYAFHYVSRLSLLIIFRRIKV
ncbi:hypothetical protein HUG20_17465 [Salicibibacter cibi]|uniref:Uncharacterized protein n=1 Tax=Salicibibacter cibi TaxID=2743001 RepID=A0A7T7CGY3_9BACI|nr:hypothetical protein [Salicibibacter cibi]QQK81524.1 hypothetical protein HUG20_17465 [Salicibibacter cibi]